MAMLQISTDTSKKRPRKRTNPGTRPGSVIVPAAWRIAVWDMIRGKQSTAAQSYVPFVQAMPDGVIALRVLSPIAFSPSPFHFAPFCGQHLLASKFVWMPRHANRESQGQRVVSTVAAFRQFCACDWRVVSMGQGWRGGQAPEWQAAACRRASHWGRAFSYHSPSQ